MTKDITIWYSDFWYTSEDTPYVLKLVQHRFRNEFNLKIDPHNPDFLVASNFGIAFHKFNCPRICFSLENMIRDPRLFDFIFSPLDSDAANHYQFPVYAYPSKHSIHQLADRQVDSQQLLNMKTDFCNFMYTNSDAPERNTFFDLLSRYRPIQSTSSHLYNIPPINLQSDYGRIKDKIGFMKRYKFTIAFENSSWYGYTTEKLPDALRANTVPIYYGDPHVHLHFNPKAFINCHAFTSWKDVIEHIIEVDNNDELYRSYLEAPVFPSTGIHPHANLESLYQTWYRILSSPPKDPVYKSPFNQFMRKAPDSILEYQRLKYLQTKGRSLPPQLL
ncbi:MAG: glycosyltransferase family 10 domain-containing protein [Gammaproteobacteria bacterium]